MTAAATIGEWRLLGRYAMVMDAEMLATAMAWEISETGPRTAKQQ